MANRTNEERTIKTRAIVRGLTAFGFEAVEYQQDSTSSRIHFKMPGLISPCTLSVRIAYADAEGTACAKDQLLDLADALLVGLHAKVPPSITQTPGEEERTALAALRIGDVVEYTTPSGVVLPAIITRVLGQEAHTVMLTIFSPFIGRGSESSEGSIPYGGAGGPRTWRFRIGTSLSRHLKDKAEEGDGR